MAGEYKSDRLKKAAKKMGVRLTKGYEVKPLKRKRKKK